MTPCTITEHYADAEGQAEWVGRAIADDPDFRAYIAGPVRERLDDLEEAEEFATELAGLAATGIASETVRAVLEQNAGPRQGWEVGEAMAEVLLSDHRGAVWPWNTERDKRTPKASLPGADLVGFVIDAAGESTLAVGEVKTSSDEATPPGVMSGRSGMTHQLEKLQQDKLLQGTLLQWLRPRCKGTEFWPHYEGAVRRFLESGGKDFVLFGMLMRDTEPHVLDLEARGRTLGGRTESPTAYELNAWHLPCEVAEWADLVAGGEQ